MSKNTPPNFSITHTRYAERMHKKGDLDAVSQAAPARQHEEQVPPDINTQAERRQLNVLFCDMVGLTEFAS